MAFSSEWETTYGEGRQLSAWPWSDLVGFVMRYTRHESEEFAVLELGCGSGSNIKLFDSLGAEYYAVEGSASAVQHVLRHHPSLEGRVLIGDFTQAIPFQRQFDVVVDRGSLTHNSTESIRATLSHLKSLMSADSVFLGINWISTECSEFSSGDPAEDEHTRSGFREGTFAGLGRVHFSDRCHIEDLFSGYDFMALEHNVRERELPADGWKFASWNFAARPRISA